MRMLVDHFLGRQAALGAGGVDELRWVRPVHPEDTLRCEATVVDKRRSRSNPQLGLFRCKVEAFNQHDQRVLHFISSGMIAVRDPDAPL
jgi:acyl dehydratase